MYNNEVTYDFRWNSKENLSYQDKVSKKFLKRASVYSDCPTSWAKEVFELLQFLDKEFGIALNTETVNGRYVTNQLLKEVTVNLVRNVSSQIYNAFIRPLISKDEKDIYAQFYKNSSMKKKLMSVVGSFVNPISYFLSSLKTLFINPIINKIRKPKMVLFQVKEKYGELMIYYSAPSYLEPYIDLKIRETEMLLAKKGAYYPVEAYYFASTNFDCNTDYHPNEYSIKYSTSSTGKQVTTVKVYNYREAMKNVGLDLEEIRLKAEERKARHSDDIP